MESSPNSPTPPCLADAPIGCVSNGGTQRYLLEAESTSGFVAWKTADGTTLVSAAAQVSLPASSSIRFWACAGYTDTTPSGHIISFDCHGNSLTHLDVRALRNLEYLDCSFNQLEQLDLAGVGELEALDADDNQLTRLEVRDLHALRVLNCAGNWLKKLDLSGLDLLQILDCSRNRLASLNINGCTSLQDVQSSGNPVDFSQLRA